MILLCQFKRSDPLLYSRGCGSIGSPPWAQPKGNHSVRFRPPRSLGPQVAPTASHDVMGNRAVYTRHSSFGYLPRGVASLLVRHEHMTCRDFHPQNCNLVGCSDVPEYSPDRHGAETFSGYYQRTTHRVTFWWLP